MRSSLGGWLVLAMMLAGCNLFQSTTTVVLRTPDSSDVGDDVDDEMSDTAIDAPDVVTPDVGPMPDADAPDMGTPPDTSGSSDFAWDPEAGRVTRDLLLFYTFEEGTGSQVLDRSSRGASPSLALGPTATWLEGRNGVHIDAPARITGRAAGEKLWDWVVPREEITVEVWVKPDNLTQTGPARIVTFSTDTTSRNFTLGQEEGRYTVRLTVNDREFDANGLPEVGQVGTASLAETHVAFTYDGLFLRLYVNGVGAGSSLRTGGLQHWDRDFLFQLANENEHARPWAGEIYMLAVYDRALTAEELARNHARGSAIAP